MRSKIAETVRQAMKKLDLKTPESKCEIMLYVEDGETLITLIDEDGNPATLMVNKSELKAIF